MTDGMFDAMRAAGEYPPKGFGYLEDHEKKAKAEELFERGCRDPWLADYIDLRALSESETEQ